MRSIISALSLIIAIYNLLNYTHLIAFDVILIINNNFRLPSANPKQLSHIVICNSNRSINFHQAASFHNFHIKGNKIYVQINNIYAINIRVNFRLKIQSIFIYVLKLCMNWNNSIQCGMCCYKLRVFLFCFYFILMFLRKAVEIKGKLPHSKIIDFIIFRRFRME